MSDAGYVCPKLDWPVGPKNHKDVLELHDEVNIWTRKFCNVGNIYEIIDELKLTYFATRVWNYGSYKRLLAISKLVVFFFIADDYFDVERAEWTQYQTGRMVEIAHSGEIVEQDSNKNWIEASFSDIWQSIAVLGPDHWKDRFIQSINLWFRTAVLELNFRDVKNVPAYVDYLALRPFSEGAEFCFHFIEFAANKYLTTKQAAEPMYQALLMYCRYVLFATNDLYSYRKEVKAGDVMNVVFVFQKEHKLAVQESIYKTIDFIKDQYDMYLCCREQLNIVFPGEYDYYLQALEDMMRGNYDFHFDSKRY